jgi:outer membrane autotransporter protein
MNKNFRTLWNPTLGSWVAAPETARGPARSRSVSGGRAAARGELRAVAMAALLMGAGAAGAAGGAGGQPVGDATLNAGAGGSNGSGGAGGLNDNTINAHGGAGGSSNAGGATAGSAADIGLFGGATPGAGGAAGAGSNAVGPGVFQGDNGGAGGAQTGDAANGNGYGGGGGGGFQGLSINPATTTSSDSHTGGSGGAGGDGYWAAGGGGAGGQGSTLVGPLGNYTASGASTGGAGGKGGDAFSQGGGGGSGGDGFFLNATTPGLTFTHSGSLTGGAGGVGGSELLPARNNATGGGGGAGGTGATLAGGAVTVNNTGQIAGGAGGAGGTGGGGAGGTGTPGGGGDGGVGLWSTATGVTVINNGTIAGGTGGIGGTNSSGGASGANGVGGAGVMGANLSVTNGGAISGGLGGDGVTRAAAVQFTGGANSLTLNAGASLTGAVAIDSGATASVIAGADGLTLASPLLLGGTGTIDTNGHSLSWSGPISGAGDLVKGGAGTLTLGGANSYTGATNVAAGTLRAGAANTLSSASAFTVATGAVLDLAGNSQAIASMSNGGTVSLPGSAPGTTLTVNGPWVGNGGTLRLGTALGGSASASDRLILSGSTAVASGTTNVQIVNLGGLGALTSGNGIEVITAQNGATTTAQTTKSAFALAGGHVDAGAYEYRLNAADANGAGENWYLRSSIPVVIAPPTTPGAGAGAAAPVVQVVTYRPEAALYAALPNQLRQGNLAMLGDLRKRVGDDDVKGTSSTLTGSERRGWARVLSTDIDIRQGGTVSPTSKGRLTGFQAGTDLFATPNWRAGIYVGQLDGDARVNGFASGVNNLRVGRTDLRSQYVGVYGTYTSDSGFYADAVIQSGRHRYTVAPSLGFGASGKGNSLLGSIEVGQSFPIGDSGWSVEPQLQLIHQHLDLGNSLISGAVVQPQADNGWIVRAGVRVKGEIDTSIGRLQPYVRFNVYKTSSGTDIARFTNGATTTSIAAPTGGTSTELAGGFTLALSESTSLYGEVGKLWSSGGDAKVRSGVNASLGVRVKW